jgi:hypothetical protein
MVYLELDMVCPELDMVYPELDMAYPELDMVRWAWGEACLLEQLSFHPYLYYSFVQMTPGLCRNLQVQRLP